jgi:predicted TIM-barrel fold metal-dependent hydrolase
MPACITDRDLELFEKHLQSFVPDRVYDAHAHIYEASLWRDYAAYEAASPREVTLEVYRDEIAMILPGREVHAMCFPFPVFFTDDSGFVKSNEWVSREIAKDPLARGQMLVRPTDDPEWVRSECRRVGLTGLKPFSFYGAREDFWEAELPEYLPEPLVAVANQEGWTITLHMVRYAGCADTSNQHWIRHYCEKYPNIRLILDHCARGFNPLQTIAGLEKLQGLDNLYVDVSVVCNATAIAAAIKLLGHEHVLYASDYCTSHYRGTNLPVADTFLWLYDRDPIWRNIAYAPNLHPTLVGTENLLAMKAACWMLDLKDSEVQAIFWDNAARVLNLG